MPNQSNEPLPTTSPNSTASKSGLRQIAGHLYYIVWWEGVMPAIYAVRRQRRRLAGEYTPARIDLTWPTAPLRIDLLNEIVERNGVQSYLEIGCRDDECFSRIRAPHKVGVDPVSGGTVRATSDEFFARNQQRFDLIFIDGLHLYEQVVRDIQNSVAALNPNGVILLHDCLPLDCVAQYREQSSRIWNGDVWKAIVEARTWPDVDTVTCLIDQGVSIIRARPNGDRLDLPAASVAELPYATLAADYRRLMRTVDYDGGVHFACGDAST